MKNKRYIRSGLKYYILYTVLFLIMGYIIFKPLLESNKLLVWKEDGLSQYFNAYVYIGEWLRSIFRNISSGNFTIPMWEFGIGQGEDIITTLSYYGIGDPFYIVPALVPAGGLEIAYSVTIVLKLYLAGLAFTLYARRMGCGRFSTLFAALIYAYSEYGLVYGLHQPVLLNQLILLPLLFWSAEKIIKKESPAAFILTVFISGISNFFLFYTLVLLTVLYVGVRLFYVRNKKLPDILADAKVFCISGLIGALMAAVIFLPVFSLISGGNTLSGLKSFPILFGFYEYHSFPDSLISKNTNSLWSYIGICSVTAAPAFVLFFRRKRIKWLFTLFAAYTVMMLIPFSGYVLCGFKNPSNRWSFAYVFIRCFIFAKCVSYLYFAKKKVKIKAGVCTVLFCILSWNLTRNLDTEMAASVIALIAFTFLCMYFPYYGRINTGKAGKFYRLRFKPLFGFITLFGIGMIGNSLYQGMISEAATTDKALAMIESKDSVLGLIEDSGFYRIDSNYNDYFKQSDMLGGEKNFLLTEGISSTMEYWSLTQPYRFEYLSANSAYRANASVTDGLQSRALLLPFSSAKYFISPGRGAKSPGREVPYGYTYVAEAKNRVNSVQSVYSSGYALPFGHFSDAYIERSAYDALDAENKQEAMLQGTVIEDGDIEAIRDINPANPVYTAIKLPYEVKENQGARFRDDTLRITNTNSKVEFSFSCPANTELYFKVRGFDYDGVRTNLVATVRGEKSRASAVIYEKGNKYYHGRKDYIFNLGYSDQERSYASISFSEIGRYRFESVELIAQPVEALDANIPRLTEDTWDSPSVSTNIIEGDISLGSDKLLCLSLPYSKGWSAYVDGQKADILKVNVMYCGIPMKAGEHSILLTYRTPLLTPGFLISILGTALFVIYVIIYKKQAKTEVA